MRFLSPTDQKCAESLTYWQFFYYRPPGKFRFIHLWEIVKMLCQELDIHIYVYIYIYMMLLIIGMDFLYQFNLGLIAPLFSFFSWKVWKKKMFFKIFKSWQVCDWLAKWMIMLRFMDLRWPRVYRRSNVGLVKLSEDIYYPKISDKFDHGGSASLNMRIMDHLMSRPLLTFLNSFFKLKSPNLAYR